MEFSFFFSCFPFVLFMIIFSLFCGFTYFLRVLLFFVYFVFPYFNQAFCRIFHRRSGLKLAIAGRLYM